MINPKNTDLARRAAMERLRVQVAFERALAQRLFTEFGRLGRQARDGYEEYGQSGVDQPLIQHTQRMDQIIKGTMGQQLTFFGDDVIGQMIANGIINSRPLTSKGIFDQAVNNHIATHGAKKVQQITETTRKVINNAISTGLEDSLSSKQIAQKIWDNTTGDIGKRRARVIARTETHTSAMSGDYYSVESLGFDFENTWLTFKDQRARNHHVDADGQTIKKGQLFNVDGELLRWPGDPNGSAGNIINCRCQMVYNII